MLCYYCWGLLVSGVEGESAGMLRRPHLKAVSEALPGAESPFSHHLTYTQRQAVGEAAPGPGVQGLLKVRNPRP